jgi:hypothetical protein
VDADALLLQEYRDRIESMGTLSLTLKAPTTAPAALGFSLLEKDGVFTVDAVSDLAEESAQVVRGSLVVGFALGGAAAVRIGSADALSGELSAGESIVVTLQLPPVPIPFRGIARYGAHKSVVFTMHPQQTQWLHENAFKGGLQLLRPATAHQSMKAAFKDLMRIDTMTTLYLGKDQIATWLAQQTKDEKVRRKVKAKEETEAKKAAALAKKEAEAKAATGDGNSRPTKQAKRGKGKQKAAPKKPPARNKRKKKADEEEEEEEREMKRAGAMGDDSTSESDDEEHEEG